MKHRTLWLQIPGWILGSIIGCSIVFAGYVYLVSQRFIHRTYAAPLVDVAVPTDAASITEGARLAQIRGCNGGCHGKEVEGGPWDDGFWQGRAFAPDLAAAARTYSVPELVRVIREGVRANGEAVQIMPSPMFFHLSDADLGKIIAFLRSSPIKGGNYAFSPGPMWRWQMVTGEWTAWPDEIRTLGTRMTPPSPEDPVRFGEYLARTSCTECHGNELHGGPATPDLLIAAAYSPEDFRKLMRTGVPLGNRELRLMSGAARSRFAHFTDAEIDSLHAYLRQRAGLPATSPIPAGVPAVSTAF
ncbi:MAG TPA: cytochrome c [Povalibacter sp.]